MKQKRSLKRKNQRRSQNPKKIKVNLLVKRLELSRELVDSLFLIIGGLFIISYFFALSEKYQPLIAGSETDSVTVSVIVTESISLSSPSDITLTPNIVEAGSSTGSVTWNVQTNNSDGWKLELNANSFPALTDGRGHSFADYTEMMSSAPETWSVDSSDSEFGFSVGGSYAEAKYSNGTLYEGFKGNSKILVAQDNSATPGGGADVLVNFKAEVGSNKSQASGTYTATITATATVL
jgi:hypothetical protein